LESTLLKNISDIIVQDANQDELASNLRLKHARLDLNEYYRKEFIQILDHQITALSDNVKVAFDIISSCIYLLLPPYKEDPKREDIEFL
jgi:hypothetical protein